jgi:hypothetical protein
MWKPLRLQKRIETVRDHLNLRLLNWKHVSWS